MKKGIIKDFMANVRKNTKKPFLTDIALVGVGAICYGLLPTALNSISKKTKGSWSVDGFKGVAIGSIVPAIIGLGFNKKQIAYGAVAAGVIHLLYAKGNGTIANVFGTPIFAFDKSINPNQIATGMSDEALPPGMRTITLPDGSEVMAATSTGVNDYISSLEDYIPSPEPYVAEPEKVQLNDYISTLSDNDFHSLYTNSQFAGAVGF